MSAPGELVDGMLGNVSRSKKNWAAKILSMYGKNGRISVALYTSHSDRMLFGDRAKVKVITITPEKFRPCDSSVQPLEVMTAVVKKRIAKETAEAFARDGGGQ